MKASSNALCQRILHAVDQGHRQAEIAAAFQVSVATINHYREATSGEENPCIFFRQLATFLND